jgi:adenylate kinase family enzyme
MPDRIAIIGNAGGGKSLWALRVGRALGLPVRVIDDVQWEPGWTRATPELIRATHAAWLAEPAWIIDGWGSWDDIAARFALADLIVVPDYPLAQHRAWALQRQAEVERGERQDWPPAGCDASTITDELLAVIDLVESDFMPRVRDMIQVLAHKTVHARTPESLDALARELGVRSG